MQRIHHRLERYPFPIAYPARLINLAHGPAEQLERISDFLEAAAVTLCAVTLAWMDSRRLALPQDWVRSVAGGGVSLGTTAATIKHSKAETAVAAHDPLAQLLNRCAGGVYDRVEGFTPTRNVYAHGGKPRSDADLQNALDVHMERVNGVLDALEPATQLRLSVVRGQTASHVELEPLMGFAEPFPRVHLPSTERWTTGALLVYPADLLDQAAILDPFCTWQRCGNCGRDELTYLSKWQKNKPVYYSFSTGHRTPLRGGLPPQWQTKETPRRRRFPDLGSLTARLFGMEPLGSKQENASGWRARWPNLAPRRARIAARALDLAALSALALPVYLALSWLGFGVLGAGLAALVAISYEPVWARLLGDSPGKRLAGLSTISVWESRELPPRDALRRAFAVSLAVALPILAVRDLAWILCDPARQTRADRWAKTIVVRTRAQRGYRR